MQQQIYIFNIITKFKQFKKIATDAQWVIVPSSAGQVFIYPSLWIWPSLTVRTPLTPLTTQKCSLNKCAETTAPSLSCGVTTAASKGQADNFPSHGESNGTRITIKPERKSAHCILCIVSFTRDFSAIVLCRVSLLVFISALITSDRQRVIFHIQSAVSKAPPLKGRVLRMLMTLACSKDARKSSLKCCGQRLTLPQFMPTLSQLNPPNRDGFLTGLSQTASLSYFNILNICQIDITLICLRQHDTALPEPFVGH